MYAPRIQAPPTGKGQQGPGRWRGAPRGGARHCAGRRRPGASPERRRLLDRTLIFETRVGRAFAAAGRRPLADARRRAAGRPRPGAAASLAPERCGALGRREGNPHRGRGAARVRPPNAGARRAGRLAAARPENWPLPAVLYIIAGSSGRRRGPCQLCAGPGVEGARGVQGCLLLTGVSGEAAAREAHRALQCSARARRPAAGGSKATGAPGRAAPRAALRAARANARRRAGGAARPRQGGRRGGRARGRAARRFRGRGSSRAPGHAARACARAAKALRPPALVFESSDRLSLVTRGHTRPGGRCH